MIFYTDGSSLGNPGPGGWATLQAGVGCRSGRELNTTNNRMELEAIIRALEWAYEEKALYVTIHTDSQYCISGATQWLSNWVNRHWKGIKNVDQWKRFLALQLHFEEIHFVKVKAHSGNPGNEYVDKKAKLQAKKGLSQ
jgi:ribonuclease HI